MSAARSVAVLALALLRCGSAEAPLSKRELAGIAGTIYYLTDHGEVPVMHKLRPDGSGAEELGPGYPYGASPDGTRIALVVKDPSGDQVATARPDGQERRVLAPAAGTSWYPTFSPDGRTLLFESSRASFRDLYALPLGGGALLRLTDDRQGNFDPAWSPDGRHIAFASSRMGQLDLYVMGAGGEDQRRLTRHPGDSVKPRWSPDGAHIAFLSGRGGRDHLHLIRPDGSALVDLMSGVEEAESFDWRPDGKALVVAVRAADRKSKLWVIELGSDHPRALSGEQHDDSQPVWSPDGSLLAFAGAGDGKSDIWIMRADGKRRTQLTHHGAAWLPRWLRTKDEKIEGRE